MTNSEILSLLFSLKDEEYKVFQSALMPTVSQNKIIGVRVPQLKKAALTIYKDGSYKQFLKTLPHKFYEQDNLHAFIINNIEDFDECIKQTESFLPFIDNWATCDGLRPKAFKKQPEKLLSHIYKWLQSEHSYTVRFAVECLMVYYLDEHFDKIFLDIVSKIQSEDYYVNMMLAWYFATALAKQYESTLPYIESKTLPLFVHRKTITKANESFRITKQQKQYLKSLR